jgi:hypothetical protein
MFRPDKLEGIYIQCSKVHKYHKYYNIIEFSFEASPGDELSMSGWVSLPFPRPSSRILSNCGYLQVSRKGGKQSIHCLPR